MRWAWASPSSGCTATSASRPGPMAPTVSSSTVTLADSDALDQGNHATAPERMAGSLGAIAHGGRCTTRRSRPASLT